MKLGLSKEVCDEIQRLLDFPEVAGASLPHKQIHNIIGIYLAKQKYGKLGAKAAIRHLLRDLYSEVMRKILTQQL